MINVLNLSSSLFAAFSIESHMTLQKFAVPKQFHFPQLFAKHEPKTLLLIIKHKQF